MRKAILISALCLSPVAVAAVGEHRAPKPHESVQQRFDAIRRNNTQAFLGTMLSDDQMDNMSAQWDEMRREPVDPEENAKFEQAMAMLTAPGAEENLMTMVRPQLAEMKAQMPMMIGMFGGMIEMGIQQDENLSAEEKAKATKVMKAVTNFLSTNNLADEASAEKAIGVVCGTARKLNLSSLDDVQKLNFDQLMNKADIVLAGLKNLFRIYGVDFDQWIDQIEVETISESGNNATVRVHYEIFGMRDSVDEELVMRNHRWVSTKVEEAIEGN